MAQITVCNVKHAFRSDKLTDICHQTISSKSTKRFNVSQVIVLVLGLTTSALAHTNLSHHSFSAVAHKKTAKRSEKLSVHYLPSTKWQTDKVDN